MLRRRSGSYRCRRRSFKHWQRTFCLGHRAHTPCLGRAPAVYGMPQVRLRSVLDFGHTRDVFDQGFREPGWRDPLPLLSFRFTARFEPFPLAVSLGLTLSCSQKNTARTASRPGAAPSRECGKHPRCAIDRSRSRSKRRGDSRVECALQQCEYQQYQQ